MAVVAHVVLPGLAKEDHDRVREATGWLAEPPAGGLSHLTWWEGGDCHNVDSWDSEEAFNAFGQGACLPHSRSALASAERVNKRGGLPRGLSGDRHRPRGVHLMSSDPG